MLLGKVCKVRTGKLDANAGSPNGKYPFFTCAQTPLKIDFYKYDCECVLIAGNCDLNVKYFNGKFEAYQRTYIIESLDKQRLDTKYLYYYLSSYLDNLKNKRAGGVIKFIKLGDLTSIEIPNLELNEQVKRVHELETIEYRKKAEKDFLICYDSLIKSRFIEMFGDPISNSKNLKTTEVINVVKLQRGFDLPVSDRNHNGDVPLYGSNGIIDHHDIDKCKKGIITGRSGTLGEVYYSNEPFWPLNTTLFSVDTHGNSIIYLKWLLTFYHLERFGSGSGVPTLNRNAFHQQQIIDVPKEEQNNFEAFANLIDKLKFNCQQRIKLYQELLDKKMDEYFG